ncbi:MAG: CoA transferase, partial [Dehalococcoidia bacterium]|nr:CoA transferase [Dehalococcoidia bacterium]
MTKDAGGLLSPYRILDLTDEKGVACGRVLADFGADVIKVERPGGDPSRNIGPFYHNIPDPEKSLFWFAYNANKRGITLDLETTAGRDLFKKLVETADAVVESFPPGYMESLGLGYGDLARINPGIILTSISPFGQTGPHKDFKGPDLITWGMGGMMYVSGDPDRPPIRISCPQSYPHGGTIAATGTMFALFHRGATGEGQHVDVSIQEQVVRTLMVVRQFWDVGGENLERIGQYRGSQRLIWPCKDGYVNFTIHGGAGGLRSNQGLVDWLKSDGV